MRLWENLAKMGKSEVARSRPAVMQALWAAGGAGVITAASVALKVYIWHGSLGMAAIAIFGALNFALSFLMMQACGFKLATKISPMVGATLGRQWRALPVLRRAHDPAELLWSLRTQLVGVLGNFLFVVLGAAVFHLSFHLRTGRSFLSPEISAATLASFHPWNSNTLILAAFTGVLLWLSTLSAGWVASFFRPKSKKLTVAFFNIFLGCFLGFVPVIGKVTHLPLDVRHFTLTGGYIAMATLSSGWVQALHAGFWAAIAGLMLIGLLNVLVSFSLSFLSAFASRSRRSSVDSLDLSL